MSHPNFEDRPKSRLGRWLYALALIIILVSAAACLFIPIDRERQALAELESSGLDIDTKLRQPNWFWEYLGDEWRTVENVSDRPIVLMCGLGGPVKNPPDRDFSMYVFEKALTKNSHFKSIFFNDVSQEEVQDIVQFQNLTTLGLTYTNLSTEELKQVAGLSNLRHLTLLPDQDLTSGYLQPIGELKKLESLYLANVVVDDEFVELLAGLTELKRLGLALPKVGKAGWAPLLQKLDLIELQFYQTELNKTDLVAIANMPSLIELSLESTNINDEGLLGLRNLKNLEEINVDQTQVTSEAVAEFQIAHPDCYVQFDIESTEDEEPERTEIVNSE